jgi:hypothetical protein|tara:strand:- start:270 stop:497 length:228 start_codon:yes stop_codon:yes gene_type:complete
MTEDEKYVSDMQNLFMTEGWKILIEEMQETVTLLTDIRNITKIEQLEFNKGMLAMINSLINLPYEIEGIEEESVH